LILPADDAVAGSDPVTYGFGGRVSHLLNGVQVSVPLFPVNLEVLPNPKLFFKYYLERFVYSDNPFTQSFVEPAEPFSLGLLVENTGFGSARNLRVTSAQPKIVENERGLFIAFEILGAQVGTLPTLPCLTVRLGDVPGQSTQVARWQLVSSLQGRFIEYAASFEHIDPFGARGLTPLAQEGRLCDANETSLLKAVEIHELHHVVLLAGDFDQDGESDFDALPDFLVNRPLTGIIDDDGSGDPQAIPQTIHSSSGGILPVRPIATANAVLSGVPSDENCVVSATVSVPDEELAGGINAGPFWGYLRFADPGDGRFELASVSRVAGGAGETDRALSTGGAGDISNVWHTHRWLPFNARPTYREHLVHLLDRFAGPGDVEYLLTYRHVPAESLRIDYATAPDRRPGRPLEGARVAGKIYPFLVFDRAEGAITRVTFFIDDPQRTGEPLSVDTAEPFDAQGGSRLAANPLDLGALDNSAGPHTLAAVVERALGEPVVVSATFEVSPALRFVPDTLLLRLDPGTSRTIDVDLETTDDVETDFELVVANADWLSVAGITDDAGTTPVRLSLTVDATGFAPGVYDAVVTARADDTSHVAGELRVTLTVTAPAARTLAFSPASVEFTLVPGGIEGVAVALSANTGAGVAVTLAESADGVNVADVPWLTIDAASGTTPHGFTVGVDAAGLAAGERQATLIASAPGHTSALLPVTLRVVDVATRALIASPTTLAFALAPAEIATRRTTIAATIGAPEVALHSFEPWLSFVPGGVNAPLDVDVTVDANQLGPGRHQGEILATARIVSPSVIEYAPVRVRVHVEIACPEIRDLTCVPDVEQSVVALAWSASADFPAGIDVYRDGVLVASLPGDARAHDDLVVPGEHAYRLEGVCAAGSRAVSDTCATAFASCRAPASLACFRGDGGAVVLEWSRPQVYTEHRVRRNGKVIATLDGAATTYTDATPGAGGEYTVEGECDGLVSEPSAPCRPSCDPPVALACVFERASGEVRLTWADGEAYDQVAVLRATDGVEIDLGRVDAGGESFTDRPTSGTHVYRVVGRCGVNAGSASCEVRVEIDARFRRCDTDGDGRVTLGDAISSMNVLFRGFARRHDCADASDCNDDGVIDVSDAVFTLLWLFRGGAEPTAPFGACGADAASDALGCREYAPCVSTP